MDLWLARSPSTPLWLSIPCRIPCRLQAGKIPCRCYSLLWFRLVPALRNKNTADTVLHNEVKSQLSFKFYAIIDTLGFYLLTCKWCFWFAEQTYHASRQSVHRSFRQLNGLWEFACGGHGGYAHQLKMRFGCWCSPSHQITAFMCFLWPSRIITGLMQDAGL